MNHKKEGSRFNNTKIQFSRQSQLSVFMIIGIIIILMTITFVILYSNTKTLDQNAVIPTELASAKTYTDYCLDVATKEVLTRIGQQSGYVDIPQIIKIDPGYRIAIYGSDYIPYWYAKNQIKIPTEKEIEDSAAPLIGLIFVQCLAPENFNALGYSLKTFRENAEVTFTINEDDVSVDIIYPIEIQSADKKRTTRLSKFSQTYDVKLRSMMTLAKAILVYENAFGFFENATISMMTMSPDIPFSDMRMDCSPQTWRISDIKESLQNSLSAGFSEVRIIGTDTYPYQAPNSVYEEYRGYSSRLIAAYSKVNLLDNLEEPDDYEKALEREARGVDTPSRGLPDDAYYYFSMRMPLFPEEEKSFENYSVDVVYNPEFGMDILAQPSSDGVLSTKTQRGMQKYLSPLCMNIYHFSYDITYPVAIYIHDIKALKGEGYDFRFALPVIIRNNEASRKNPNHNFIPAPAVSDTFCQNVTTASSRKMITVYDAQTSPSTIGAQKINDVNISMLCVNKECQLGITPISGTLLTRLTSACGNPYLLAKKEGYLTSHLLVENLEELEYNIPLIKLKNYTMQLTAHYITNDNIPDGGHMAATGSNIIVSIHGSAGGQMFEQTSMYEIESGKATQQISLPVVDGDYDVSLTYLINGEDYSGGYEGVWKPTASQLHSNSIVSLHVLEVLPKTLEEDAAKDVGVIGGMYHPLLSVQLMGAVAQANSLTQTPEVGVSP